jgi:hypothetical protein
MSLVVGRLRIIGWEVEMGNARKIVAVFLICGCAAAAAEAQPTEPQHVEIGASLGSVLTWFYGGHAIGGGDVRVAVPIRGGRAIEGFVGLTPVAEHATTGVYGLLVRRPLRDQTDPDVEQFFSYGVVGAFSHYNATDYRNPSVSHSNTVITPPVIGLLGGGVQYRVAPRVKVRLESQLVMALILPVGVRAAAGISVPLGRLSSQ